jgi:hypothetical protein
VNDVKFYYFNKDGKFIAKGSLWEDISTTNPATDEAVNLSALKVAVVSVPHYDANNRPTRMITVVNPPSTLNISEGTKLEDVLKLMTDYKMTKGDNSYFVMTTSSYYKSNESNGRSDDDAKYYYTTPLSESDFHATVKEAKESATVNVYVERLAVKIRTKFDSNLGMEARKYIYRLGTFHMNADESDKTDLYIKFIGWAPNGVGKDNESYYIKHLNSTWSEETSSLGFKWNDPNRYRSYWAMSPFYHDDTHEFPEKYATKGYGDNSIDGFEAKFVSATSIEQGNSGFGGEQYCNEWTQSAKALSKKTTDGTTYDPHLPGAVSHVLLLAKFCDKDGNEIYKEGKTIVKYSGDYYYQEDLLKRFYEYSGVKGIKYQSGTDDNNNPVYTNLTAEDLTIVKDTDDLNGKVMIELDSKYADTQWVKDDGSALTGKKADNTPTQNVNELLDTYQGTQIMIRYTNGLMYYYSLIRHLNDNKSSAIYDLNEAYYGIVRNHIYDITLLGFAKRDQDGNPKDNEDPIGPDGPGENEDPIDPGHGVDEPDEPIIPNDEVDTNYYIGANINILSWRVVEQNVKL